MALTDVFTGAHGTLGIAEAGTDAEAADFRAISTAYGIGLVGRVTDVEVRVETELEEFYELGKRDAQSLHPGNVHISGKIGRAYINGALIYLLMGRGAKETEGSSTIQPRFVLNLALKDPAEPGNQLKVNIFGVRFQNWGLHIPQDDFLVEQVTFKGTSIGITDTEATNEIIVGFPEAT